MCQCEDRPCCGCDDDGYNAYIASQAHELCEGCGRSQDRCLCEDYPGQFISGPEDGE